MRAAADADDYTRDPEGAYLAVTRGLVFCHRRAVLWGFALWGRPTAEDVRRVVALLARELREPAGQMHASLVDLRRLEAVDPRAFAIIAKYLATNYARFATRVARLALVRPPGILGATVAGFFDVELAPYPVRVFDTLSPAAQWLAVPAVAGELEAALAGASELPAQLVVLRRWLDAHVVDATLSSTAKALHRAARSLQRDLATHGTAFQTELDAARIRLARRLLVETDSPLTEIAYDIGCASPQHFSTLFRRLAGRTPSAFRLAETPPRRW